MSNTVNSAYYNAMAAADSSGKTSSSSSSTSTKSTTDALGEQFMNLMLTQLRNQNPLEPLNENEMLQQITQLNTLQQLEKISKSLQAMEQTNQFMSASNLIGKTVIYKNDKDEQVSALVNQVYLDGSTVMLKIGDGEKDVIKLSSVMGVQEG